MGISSHQQWDTLQSAVGAQVQFETTAGKTYRVEYSDDLTTNQWSVLTEKITGDGAPVIVIDPAAAKLRQRFYRLVLTSPEAH